MSDPNNISPDGAAQNAAPVVTAPAQPAPVAPAPVAAQPAAAQSQTPAPPPAQRPPYINPWAHRAAPSQPAKPATAAPAPPANNAAAPVVDPRVSELEARINGLMGTVKVQADDALAAVPENVRNTVIALAGDDPTARLAMLRTLKANGMIAPAAQTVTPGATTMPAAPAPPVVVQQNPDVDAFKHYENLRAKSPVAAAQYLSANGVRIARGRAAVANKN